MKDPGFITLSAGLVAGFVLGLRATLVGWVLGLVIGIAVAVRQTTDTPKNERRRKFITYIGSSGKWGSPFPHDSRLAGIIALGFLGVIAGVLGGLLGAVTGVQFFNYF